MTMKIGNETYYTPHQMASFFAIKKDTLLFYDKIGLFSPVKRNANGYRYYSASQINELDTILTLKDLGIPLAAIMDVVRDMDTPSFLSLLDNTKRSIQTKIDECNSLLDFVNSVKASVEEAMGADKERLYLKDSKPLQIVTVPIENTEGKMTSDDNWQKAYSRLMAEADCKAIINVGSIVHLDEGRMYLGGICREVYATYTSSSDRVIPGGHYAYMFFSGSLENLSSFYRTFFNSLDSSGLIPAGDIYEELTISTTNTKEEKEHVTKLMVRIDT